MKRWLASLMVALWCIGIADAAPGHVHVWATGLDGHVHVAHTGAAHAFDAEAFDIHEHDLLGAHEPAIADGHHHDFAIAVHGDTTRTPSASDIPPPSQKLVSHAPMTVRLLLPSDWPGGGTFVGGDPPRPSPGLLQHRSVVLRI